MTPLNKSSLVALAALAAVGTPLLFVDAPGTTASWKVTTTTPGVAAKSDTFTSTVSPAGTTMNHLDPGTASWWNRVGVRATNTSQKLTGTLSYSEFTAKQVKSAADTTATASTTENRLFANSTVALRTSNSADCSTLDAGTVATVNLGTGNSTAASPVAGSFVDLVRLAPGASKSLCVVTAEKSSPSTSTYVSYLLNHGGRQIRYDWKQRFRSSANATWGSTQNVTQVLTVKAPPITIPYGKPADVCQIGFGNNTVGDVAWAWPTANESHIDDPETPAINRWAVMRKAPNTGGVFVEWTGLAATTGSSRDLYGLPSSGLNGESSNTIVGAWAELYLRGYFYAGDSARYVNADHVFFARKNAGKWECGSSANGKPVTTNTNTGANAPGPHGL